MSSDEEIRTLLRKIEANQRASLDLQRDHLELTKILLPIVGILLALIVYLRFRWDIL